MKNPKVSVIIPVYNGQRTLRQCLSSVINQNYRNYEVIVVDNNSTDRSREIAHEFQAKYKKVRYIFEERQGVSYARNTGWKKSNAKYITYLDSDAMACKNWIKNIVEIFEKQTVKLGAVGGKVTGIFEQPRPRWLYERFDDLLGILDCSKKPVFLSGKQNLFCVNMALPRYVLKEVDGFNTNLGRVGDGLISSEEAFLQYKLREMGYKIFYSPDVCVNHLISSVRLNKKWFKKRFYYEGISNSRMYLIKNASSIKKFIKIPKLIVSLFFPPLQIIGLLMPEKNPKLFYYKCIAIMKLAFIQELIFSSI